MKVKLKNLLVTKSTSIGECMQRLNATAEKCLIVTDNKKNIIRNNHRWRYKKKYT